MNIIEVYDRLFDNEDLHYGLCCHLVQAALFHFVFTPKLAGLVLMIIFPACNNVCKYVPSYSSLCYFSMQHLSV